MQAAEVLSPVDKNKGTAIITIEEVIIMNYFISDEMRRKGCSGNRN